MLLTETFDKKLLEDDSKYYQIKENGVRAIVHVKDGKVVGIRNRSNNPILYQFPELKEIEFPFKTAILDGEICVFKNGRSEFYGGVDKRRSAPTDSTLKDYPATLVVFDALKVEKEVLVTQPYKIRYSKINTISPTERIKVAKNYAGIVLWDMVTNENHEGVVIKNPMAMYEMGKRSTNYIKLKNYKICDVVVDKVEPNSKGVKIFGKTNIGDKEIEVEAQLGGIFDVPEGSTVAIKYLDIAGDRLIQPTKVKREQQQ